MYTLAHIFDYNLEELKLFVSSQDNNTYNSIEEYRYMTVYYLYNQMDEKNKEIIDNPQFQTRMLQAKTEYSLKHSILGTTTLTFSGCVENHANNQMIGDKNKEGYTYSELETIYKNLKNIGKNVEFHDLRGPIGTEDLGACIFILRNGCEFADELFEEQNKLEYDKKAFMKGRVVNKNARHNLCFADMDQNPEYESGKGTVVDFKHLPVTNKLRNTLPELFGNKAFNLYAEGNYYYDIKNTYIGPHGDSERKLVIGVRLGNSLPLYYQWYLRFQMIGDPFEFVLNHGDIYIMSEKAVGTDWKKSSILTLRHSAGLKDVLSKHVKK